MFSRSLGLYCTCTDSLTDASDILEALFANEAELTPLHANHVLNLLMALLQ